MLDKRLKHSINKLCDESSVQLQECLTVNRITNAKGIKLVSRVKPASSLGAVTKVHCSRIVCLSYYEAIQLQCKLRAVL